MNKIDKNSAPREMIRELQILGDSINSSLETRNLLQDIINRYNGQDLEAQALEAQEVEDQAKYQEAKALAAKYREAEDLEAQVQALADKYQEAKALADKYREDKYREARADKYREAREAEDLADKARADKYQEFLEEAKAQLNAKLARELTLARIDALFHWEDCFLTGVVDDEHRFFIARVLAREAKALQEENDNE